MRITRPRIRSRRIAVLLAGGLSSIAIGATYIVTPESQVRSKGFAWLPTHLDANELAWVWVITGTIALVSALASHRKPKLQDTGVGALICGPVVWATIFACSAIVGDNPRGLVTTAVYAGYITLYAIIAGWRDPPTRTAQIQAVPPGGENR